MAEDRLRTLLALRMVVIALVIGFVVHSLFWWSTLGSVIYWPLDLLFILGPALLPAIVVALLIWKSDRYDNWSRVSIVLTLVFVLEQIVFWWWRSTVGDPFGFSAFYLLPILWSMPLGAISYGVAAAWTKR